jgi:hypothetical protein
MNPFHNDQGRGQRRFGRRTHATITLIGKKSIAGGDLSSLDDVPAGRSHDPIDRGIGRVEDNGMEPRLAKHETAVEFIQREIKELKDDLRAAKSDINGIRTTDFRILFGAIIAVALGLAGLMSKGFHWL